MNDDAHDEARLDTLQGRFIGMFSYGSNNERQLRARVKSPRLRGCPAFLDGFVRVFGYSSPPWGGGSVASVVPKEGGRVYGCFYLMTPQEVEILDLYEHVKEGSYLKEAVMVNVRVASGSSGKGGTAGRNGGDDCDASASRSCVVDVRSSAITYVMSQRYVQTFVFPSPQYLTAVYRTLATNFPELSDRPIEVCDYTGSRRSKWKHPGVRALPLEAFLLEVGLKEEPPWTFPYVLGPLAARLAAAGIATTDDLCEAVKDGVLLSRLATADAAAAVAAIAAAAANAANAAHEQSGGTSSTDIGAQGNGGETAAVPGGIGALPTQSCKILSSSTTVPELTVQTVDIIARIVSASSKGGGEIGSRTPAS